MDKSSMIKLVSAEGHEFYVHRKCAMVSGTIKVMLSGQFAESRGEIKFPEISAKVLERTAQYFYYKLKHTNHSGQLPEFKIDPENALELLMAANFLDC